MTAIMHQDSQAQTNAAMFYTLPPTGFLSLNQICGDKNKNPPIHGLLPVSPRTFIRRVEKGDYPKPIKLGRSNAWKVEDIVSLIQRIGGTA